MRPGRAADHSPPSSAAVMEEKSYTSTQSLGHTGPVTGSLYLYIYIYVCVCVCVYVCVCSIGLSFALSFNFLFAAYKDVSMLVKNNSPNKPRKWNTNV